MNEDLKFYAKDENQTNRKIKMCYFLQIRDNFYRIARKKFYESIFIF